MSEVFPTGIPASADDLDARRRLRTRLGRVGVWSLELRFGDPGAGERMRQLNSMSLASGRSGYRAASAVMYWEMSHVSSPPPSNTVIATGILNIWKHDAREVGEWWSALPAHRKERVLLGLGVSHGPLIGETYRKPLTVMRAYLTQLSARACPRRICAWRRWGPRCWSCRAIAPPGRILIS